MDVNRGRQLMEEKDTARRVIGTEGLVRRRSMATSPENTRSGSVSPYARRPKSTEGGVPTSPTPETRPDRRKVAEDVKMSMGSMSPFAKRPKSTEGGVPTRPTPETRPDRIEVAEDVKSLKELSRENLRTLSRASTNPKFEKDAATRQSPRTHYEDQSDNKMLRPC
jgi:hypothetical protein